MVLRSSWRSPLRGARRIWGALWVGLEGVRVGGRRAQTRGSEARSACCSTQGSIRLLALGVPPSRGRTMPVQKGAPSPLGPNSHSRGYVKNNSTDSGIVPVKKEGREVMCLFPSVMPPPQTLVLEIGDGIVYLWHSPQSIWQAHNTKRH